MRFMSSSEKTRRVRGRRVRSGSWVMGGNIGIYSAGGKGDLRDAELVNWPLTITAHAQMDMEGYVFSSPAEDLASFLDGRKFGTIMADPPWRFQNQTGKIAPEHRRLSRYGTMSLDEIKSLPVADAAADTAHLYLWVPNALLPDGLNVMSAWGFTYKSNLIWHKVRKDGGSDGRGVGFYFRNVTEILLFGTRGKNARTLPPARRQVNLFSSMKREHSRKPEEQYPLVEACSTGPFLELFARSMRTGWHCWGNEVGRFDAAFIASTRSPRTPQIDPVPRLLEVQTGP